MIMGFYCYTSCPVGTYKLSDTRCAPCYPSCGKYIDVISTDEKFEKETKFLWFEYEKDGALYNLSYPVMNQVTIVVKL